MKLFGTDGIRGEVDSFVSHDLIVGVGKSLAKYIHDKGLVKKVLLAKDTRKSGSTFLHALVGVLSNYGIDCYVVGIAPTGAVSYLIRELKVFSFGVMITASHSPANYNGVKIFNRFGLKLSDEEEKAVEKNYKIKNLTATSKGKIFFDDSLIDKYLDNIYKNAANFENLSVAIDSANGANYFLAPLVYRQLGAKVVAVGSDKDGVINGDCGAQFVENVAFYVEENFCHLGYAFDGDADRLRVVLENGKILDGDDLLYIFAKFYKENNLFTRPIVVGTVMTNGGLEKALNNLDVTLVRVDVGDKNIINYIHENSLQLGGEPSGHFCNYDINSSCDALLNSVVFTKIFKYYNHDIEGMLSEFKRHLQTNDKISLTDNLLKQLNSDKELHKELEAVKEKYKNIARIVVRPSGTEPICRIMVESESGEKNFEIMSQLKKVINNYL